MADHDSLISQFFGVTGTSDTTLATQCLTAANWDLERATGLYFDFASGQGPATAQPTQQQQHEKPQPTTTPVPKTSTTKSSSSGGGIRGFSDLTKDKDEDRESYYAGGSEKSGVQIQDPRNKNNGPDVVSKVFENAKKQGAQKAEDLEREKQQEKFGGSGYRLGNTNLTPTAPTVKPPPKQERILKVITFYKNGFTINDGALRPYQDPKNAEFLEDINQGYIPRELEAEANGQEVHTELVDKKNEEYKEPPKPKIIAFSGHGQTLGGTTNNAAPPPPTVTDKKFVLDESKPVTTIQIRLGDGGRLVAKFNHDHTILDIRAYIESNSKPKGAYDLIPGYPPKPLIDPNQTIKDAGLINASIVQKYR